MWSLKEMRVPSGSLFKKVLPFSKFKFPIYNNLLKNFCNFTLKWKPIPLLSVRYKLSKYTELIFWVNMK